MTTRTKGLLALLAVLLLALAAACTQPKEKNTEQKQRESVERENAAAATGFTRLTKGQQVPVFDFSQERQTLIEVLSMRAKGTHGTASAYSLSGDLLWWCPTQGAPIPSTYQLTPSQQYVDIKSDGTREKLPVDQGEQTGVYTGDSAATWTLCLDNRGKPFAQYEEANVRWTSGVVEGLPADKRVSVDEITFDFKVTEK
jgi:hypothetical protein